MYYLHHPVCNNTIITYRMIQIMSLMLYELLRSNTHIVQYKLCSLNILGAFTTLNALI